jgi:hypothetical protein
MPAAGGRCAQVYNARTGADTVTQLIAEQDVTDHINATALSMPCPRHMFCRSIA